MAGVVLKSLGRAASLTTATTVSTLVRLPILWFATLGGISGVAGAQLVAQVLWLLAIFAVVASVLRVRMLAVLAPLVPSLLVSAVVGACALVSARTLPPQPGLAAGVAVAALSYAIMLRLVCADALQVGLETLRAAWPRRRAFTW
jgi:hypothetical protein